MLRQLPDEYLNTITVHFNKCAVADEFFQSGKLAKGIFLSKDGACSSENKLRPISLLRNLAKAYERIVVGRIEQWCGNQGIHVDEQSGFTARRRLQTRIVSTIEDHGLMVAACNRPALALFVHFSTASERLRWPVLMNTLERLDMPLGILKWIFKRLESRKRIVSHMDKRKRGYFLSLLDHRKEVY